MSLESKLSFARGMTVRIIGKPAGLDLDDSPHTGSSGLQGVIAFVTTLAEVKAKCSPVIDAAKMDRLAWIAYPKAGQLGTDLNRDVLWQYLLRKGVQGVRQVSINDVWSAIRFRPRQQP